MFRKQIRKYILIISCILIHIVVIAATPIKGVIFDLKTNEPLPYVNILIKGTTNGTITNSNGEFELDEELTDDAILVISFIGYKNLELKFDSVAKQKLVTIFMEAEDIALGEVKILPDNTFARSLIKNIVKNRKRNNPDNFNIIDYKEYKREAIFMLNLSKDIIKSKAFKSSADAFISQSDSTVSMPVFISEETVNHSIDKSKNIDSHDVVDEKLESIMPKLQKTLNTIVSKKITSKINFYDSQVSVLARGFPSPIGVNNRMYYNSYLVDSNRVDGIMRYRFDFYPKSYRSAAFKGYYWVDSETFALTEIHAKVLATANVNFVDDFEAHVYFQPIAGKRWFYKGMKIKVNLVVAKSQNKKQKQRNLLIQNLFDFYDVNTPDVFSYDKKMYRKKMRVNDGVVASYEKTPLDSLEILAYEGIRKLKNNRTIKNVGRFSNMTLSGYYNLNKFDIGSYMDIYRKNAIEGDRFTLPIRTSEKMFKDFTIGGYIGYGLKNKEAKYGGTMKYQFKAKRRTILSLKYDYDYYALTKDKFIEFIRENPFEAGGGNVASSVTTRVPNPYLLKQKKASVTLERQLGRDVGLTLRPFWQKYYSNVNMPFTHNGHKMEYFNNYGILTNFRFSFGQPFDDGFFYRVYYGNQKPVIHLSALFGKYSFKEGNQTVSKPYLNVNLSVKNRVNFGAAFARLLLNVGYVAGDVPYPLLFTPRGTQDLGYARYHYNLLYNSSFAADLYTNVHVSVNGGGTIFGKFPLIKKLNLRETLTFKSFWGRQLGNHNSVMDVPEFLRKPMTVPYMEMGFGITNIFKVLRIEYIYRLNQPKIYNQFSSKHGVRVRIEVSF